MSSIEQAEIIKFLTQRAAPITDEEAANLASRYFGINGIIHRLSSERDQNFRLTAPHGSEYILKLTHPAEPSEITNFQTAGLLHISAMDATLPVPHIYRNLEGAAETVITLDGRQPQIMRLLSYMQGTPLSTVEHTSALRQNIATCLARIGLALRDYTHPAEVAKHELLWDIKHASNLRELLIHIPDTQKRGMIEKFLDNFEEFALPVLSSLRWQVIHNDLNPYNVLVDSADHERVAGIFDFGDMVYTPLIIDVAVAAAYNISVHTNPLDTATEFIAAYHSTYPLMPAEIDILFDLLATRLAMIVLISNWQAACYPENKNYILRNNSAAMNGLERLRSIDRLQAREYLRKACGPAPSTETQASARVSLSN